MPELSQQSKTVESINRNTVHQSLVTHSSQVALARSKSSTLNDPNVALDNLRSLLQSSINQEIEKVLKKYADKYFTIALTNAKNNLGSDKVDSDLIDRVCVNVLESAKSMYQKKKNATLKRKRVKSTNHLRQQIREITADAEAKRLKLADASTNDADLILVGKNGKPVRREGPKWDPSRLSGDTLYILETRANKALGFGQTKGKLYPKHPELLKYSADQEDKEWFVKNKTYPIMSGKVSLMVLEDVIELSRSADYVSNPKQQPRELIGFSVPPFVTEKIKHFVATVKTDPDIPDDKLTGKVEEQIALWNRLKGPSSSKLPDDGLLLNPSSQAVSQVEVMYMQEILNEIKKEQGSEDELGFLHGMNLNNLVKELEMDTAAGDASHHLGGILSLADDSADEAEFPELAEEGDSKNSTADGTKNSNP